MSAPAANQTLMSLAKRVDELQRTAELVVTPLMFDAAGDATADDSNGVQGALSAAAARPGAVLDGLGRTYKVTTELVLPSGVSDLAIVNARFVWAGTTGSSGATSVHKRILKNARSARTTGRVPTANPVAGERTITLSTADAALVQIGDVVQVITTKGDAANSSYLQGTYRRCVGVNSGTGVVTLDGPIAASLNVVTDNVTVNVYVPSQRVVLDRVRFVLPQNSRNQAVDLADCMDSMISRCAVDGGTPGSESFIGLGIGGINNTVDSCRADSFWDPELRFGYGVLMYGHDLVLRNTRASYCKHGAAGGNSSYVTNGWRIDGGNFNQAMIDAHGNCRDVTVDGAVVKNVGAMWSTAGGTGIWLRGAGGKVIDCDVSGAVSQATATAGIKVYELGVQSMNISGNRISNVDYGVKADEASSYPQTALVLSKNIMTNVGVGVQAKQLDGAEIEGNIIAARGTGIYCPFAPANLTITDNTVSYGSTVASAVGIQLGGDGTPGFTGKTISIGDNTIKAAAATAGSPIRVLDHIDGVSIVNNALDVSLAPSVSPVNLSSATELVTYFQDGNTGGVFHPFSRSAAPSSGAWRVTDIVWNSSPTTGAPIGWVCVASGSPGTWTAFGMVGATAAPSSTPPAANGLQIWSWDPVLHGGTSQQAVNGTLYLTAIYPLASLTLSRLWVMLQTAGSSPDAGKSFLGLYGADGTLLQSTADMGTALSSTALRNGTITSQAVSAGALYWIGLLVNFLGTVPKPYAFNGGASSLNGGLGITASKSRFAVNGTGLASLPGNIDPAANTGSGAFSFWVGAS